MRPWKAWPRLLSLLRFGRRRETTGWTLFVSRAVPTVESYRSSEFPTLGDLADRLTVLGYELELLHVDEAGDIGGAADPRSPLIGSSFALRDRRLGPRSTRVVIRISHQITGDRGGVGFIDAVDTSANHYHELAGFAILALAGLMPGLRYKRTDSALGPDPAELVRATLPDRPRAFS